MRSILLMPFDVLAALVRLARETVPGAEIRQELHQINRRMTVMSLNISALVAAVEKTRGVEASMLQVFDAMRAELARIKTAGESGTGNLQAQIDELATSLDSGAAPLAAAVAAGGDQPAAAPGSDPAAQDPSIPGRPVDTAGDLNPDGSPKNPAPGTAGDPPPATVEGDQDPNKPV